MAENLMECLEQRLTDDREVVSAGGYKTYQTQVLFPALADVSCRTQGRIIGQLISPTHNGTVELISFQAMFWRVSSSATPSRLPGPIR